MPCQDQEQGRQLISKNNFDFHIYKNISIRQYKLWTQRFSDSFQEYPKWGIQVDYLKTQPYLEAQWIIDGKVVILCVINTDLEELWIN